MENISILNKTFDITDNTHFYLGEIIDFDPSKLVLDSYDNVGFDIKLSVSLDEQNYTNPILVDDFDLSVLNIQTNDMFVRISFIKTPNMKINEGFQFTHNLDNTHYRIKLIKIVYNNKNIENVLRIENDSYLSKIISDVKWNFYDNQKVVIDTWLKQCQAVNDTYGHVCVYFKTNPSENGTNNILSNNFLRDVTSVKKFRISFPGNQLPQDKIIYSEWDMMLDGDSMCHVIDSVFKQVFGEYEIPTSKDFIYLPIVNKLFRVSSVQPKNGYMAVIGWWEVYLSKFEDDETINFSDEIEKALGLNETSEITEYVTDFNEYVQDTNFDDEYIDEIQTDEKKEATENYTNKLTDKVDFIDVKETENQRNFISKRLGIVSVAPDGSAFPITMYNAYSVEKRTIGLTYDLFDATSLNKHSLKIETSTEIEFQYVLNGRFQGEILDVEDENGVIIFTVENNYTKISLINHITQENFEIDYKFEKEEFYSVYMKFDKTKNNIIVKVYKLTNKIKTLIFEDVKYLTVPFNVNSKMKNMYLYGGNYYISQIVLKINDNKVIHDYVNPILKS